MVPIGCYSAAQPLRTHPRSPGPSSFICEGWSGYLSSADCLSLPGGVHFSEAHVDVASRRKTFSLTTGLVGGCSRTLESFDINM
jgi:hypothetical protein